MHGSEMVGDHKGLRFRIDVNGGGFGNMATHEVLRRRRNAGVKKRATKVAIADALAYELFCSHGAPCRNELLRARRRRQHQYLRPPA